MIRIVLVLAASFVFGCDSTDGGDQSHPIPQGTYETQDWKDTPESTQRDQVTYSSETYTYREIVDGCIACRMTGNWRVTEDRLIYSDVQIQCRSDCSGEFRPMNPIPDYSTKIRNVSAAGYDTWMEPREGYPGFWKPFKAL